MPYKCQKRKLDLKVRIQTYQILTNDDEVCIPSLSSILLAVPKPKGDSPNSHNSYFFHIFKQICSKKPLLLSFVGPKRPSGNCFLTEKTGLTKSKK